MKKLILTIVMTGFIGLFSNAGTILQGKDASERFEGAEMVRYKDNISAPNYIRFSENKGPLTSEVENWIFVNFDINKNFELQLQKTEEDQLGFSHLKFIQNYNGIKVEFATIIVHSISDRVSSINGTFIQAQPGSSHSLTESNSLKNALNFVNAAIYKWEIPEEEAFIKRESGNAEATFYPQGEKVYLPENADFSSDNIIPCWKFDIYASAPLYRAYIYVDANTGEVVFENKRIKDIDSASTGMTSYSGLRNIVSDYYIQGKFRLREKGRGKGIETYDMLNGTSHGAAVDITSDSSYFHDTLRMEYATDAHWGAEMVYDYFWTVHNRNSIDDKGFKLRSYVHYSNNYANAFWDGQRMTYGDGNSNLSALTTVDIVGHEITHGVDQYTSNLIYQGESGALDESFCDIFGNAVEAKNKPDPVKNWLVGEDLGFHLRSMSNPKSKRDPDTYGGTYWYIGTADNGGVHTNSGVQNFWFYLLSVGGSGTNDSNNTYNVTGITINKAELIAHRSRAIYLTSNSDYDDAMFYSIQAAYDIYGACSPELASTVNAWYAVGLGSAYVPKVESDFVVASPNICTVPAQVAFTNLSNYNAISYLWDFGDGKTSSLKNPTHIYAASGNYTVKLTATGNSTCGSDVEIKNAYIVVDPPVDIQVGPYSICDGYPARIRATAQNTAYWFSDLASTDPIFVGNPYVSPPLFRDTIFYAANGVPSASQKVGPADNTFGIGSTYPINARYLSFDVIEKLTLQSVKVYSFDSTLRTIELRDNTGKVLQARSVVIPLGEQVIDLNFIVDVGSDYQLGLSTSSKADLFRNSTGGSYPYTINGLVSITSPGNVSSGYYYFFYDWKVKGRDCVGNKFAVDVTVDYDPGCVAYSGIEESNGIQELSIYPNPSNGIFNVEFELNRESALTFRMIDSKGSLVFVERNLTFESGPHTYTINKSNMSKGIYLLHIEGDSFNASKRIIVE